MEVTNSIFEGLDWVILGLYFAILIIIADKDNIAAIINVIDQNQD